ncbi:TRAP transporter substrate-binding protein [Evansella sp. AB-P1]|uniref:TRAP transporter substrate-binding protein n=1 Tax=Evansella sp. AB-P1 TaxID=3037653 RepID=UPI00241D7AFF|nr:TRAP transporter substrate-binding protein [Evansella sp. AB-P1]MDG5787134.1 TRAP transporter substrate-binding protein [Evansella sp. AB-P1]
MVKKSGFLLFMSIVASLFIIVGCSEDADSNVNGNNDNQNGNSGASVDDGEVYEIVFAHVVRPTTAKGQGAERFAELIEERTDGRITVNVYPDSQLGSDREITEQMQTGTVHMNAPFTGVLPSFVPQFQVFDLPFLFEDKDQAYDAMHGALGEELNNYLTQQGLLGLGYWDGGFKHFTNSVRAIETPEDMDGLRMRASQSPLIISQFQALNAGGVSIDFSELYTALQNETVDGQENPLSNIVSRSFYEVQDHMTLSGHGYMGYVLLINEEFFNNLPGDLQEIMHEVAMEVSEWQWEIANAEEEEYMDYLENETDIVITELTPENREAFLEATIGAYDEFAEIEGSDRLLQIIEEMRGN